MVVDLVEGRAEDVRITVPGVRKAEIDVAHVVEALKLFGAQFPIQHGEIILKLAEFARAQNRDHQGLGLLLAHPVDRHLRPRFTCFFGDGAHGLDDLLCAFGNRDLIPIHAGRFGAGLGIFAGQHARRRSS